MSSAISYLSLLTLVALFDNVASGPFNRSVFPHGFLFGASSSAYQYEGAFREDGKGQSIWDNFTHAHPEKIKDGSNGDVAEDFFLHNKVHGFSISWTRILPDGNGGINIKGIEFYDNLINELVSNGIQPFVTIFHWDSPQALEDQYGGFLSDRIVVDFSYYAEVLFREYGDRVKHWITFNEPWGFCNNGYGTGTDAPGRCSADSGNCTAGDSRTEPYTVCHHQLLAHAAAVRVYKEKYQTKQKGEIGITLVSPWFVPLSSTGPNINATHRILDFFYGWFMDPLTRGDYPQSMRAALGNRLPNFTNDQSEMVKGAYDFIGINYYDSFYAFELPSSADINPIYLNDSRAGLTGVRNGRPIGPQADSAQFYIYPLGLQKLLKYTRVKYNNPPIFITENGVPEENNSSKSIEEALKDDFRIAYHQEHLKKLHSAIKDGVDVRGYFVWTFLDDFEWSGGFTVRYGLNYVDFKNGTLKRYPKNSARWFRDFLGK
uniref:Beta-glucosidase 12-like n=1 Tax=Ananas comosus var. bracteatus TaxID=296719 RepID=A0A6V7QWG8_ANACO